VCGGAIVTGAIDPIADLVAVASREAARAEAYAREWEISRGYGSYEELLADAEIAAVDAHKWLYQPLDCSVLLPGRAAARGVSSTDDYAASLTPIPWRRCASLKRPSNCRTAKFRRSSSGYHCATRPGRVPARD
jgi:hypothetical protein